MSEQKNMMERINSFLSELKTAFNQQGWIGKILFPSLILLVSCLLCSILLGLFQWGTRNSSSAVPSQIVLPSVGIGSTPTALFSFGSGTFTPFPTFPAPSALPTLTGLPTTTATFTQTPPAATGTPFPTVTIPLPTATITLPTVTAQSGGSVTITALNKAMEYVDLQNLSNAPVDLRGWKLVSETGNQSCRLRGVLQPNEVLRVWARTGDPGFSCKFPINIWNDNQSDPAVLYNSQGEEVSKFP